MSNYVVFRELLADQLIISSQTLSDRTIAALYSSSLKFSDLPIDQQKTISNRPADSLVFNTLVN
jgi:hypothetical protein